MSIKGAVSRIRGFRSIGVGLMALAGTLLVAETAVAKSPKKAGKSDPLYKGSFSAPAGSLDVEAADVWEQRSESLVPTLNSFPVRVQVAESDINGWRQPQSVSAPKKINKTFKINNCQFNVNGGEYSVRRYGNESADDLNVLADAVMPQSTFSVEVGEAIHFSLTTSLTVAVEPKFAQACKETFSGRMYSIGSANLDGSELYGVGERGTAAPAVVVRANEPTALYVTWDKEGGRLSVVDQIGLVPEVESPVFALTFDKKDAYYLGFEAELKIVRDREKLAGK